MLLFSILLRELFSGRIMKTDENQCTPNPFSFRMSKSFVVELSKIMIHGTISKVYMQGKD